MEEDTEYTKLAVEDRCVHKLWKARLHGYEECTKTFQCIDDEKSPEWNKFLGLVKKFVIDSNAAAQEKGLEAVLAYVENAAVAGKTTNDVMSGIVNKCIAAPKAKTKELAVQVTLMYIEIEKHEAVQEELMKGTEAKNPKIISACINILTQALREFGPQVINVKPLMKKIPTLLEDRDKTVRDETKALVVEIYRWIGAPLKQQLNTLKPVQLSELETEFNNLKSGKATVTRYLKSKKPKVACHVDNNTGDGESGDEVDDDDNGNQPDIDPYELLDPVDILSKLPKDFYDKIESKKWQERKEALEALETLIKNPKLENGDYGEVVRALKKVVGKDSNVVVVTLAGKCLTGLANGLKKRFSPYATACLPTILEKFKEKKQTVVVVLRECADAIFLSINVEQIMEDVLAALENKNPSVKAETAAFLSRCFSRTPPASLNKKLLKAYTGPLLKTLNESDPLVRDNSADALGTAMKLVGEKAMAPFLIDLDNLKMTKIKECAEKAVIHVKVTVPKKSSADRPNTAPGKIQSPTRGSDNDAKAKRPKSGAPTKKPVSKKISATSSTTNLGSKKAVPKVQVEKNLSNEEIDEMASETLPSEILSGLVDSNWKARLAAVEQLLEHIKQMDPSQVSSQLIVRILGKKPGFKDTNFQVLKLRLELVKFMAENFPFSSTVTEYCLMDVTEKLGDAKNSATASETLTAIAEATSLELVANEIMSFAFNQKNPKVQQETLLWLSKALTEFGFSINTKALIDNVKKAVGATNPGIRTAAITLIGTMYLYIGRSLLTFFDNEKPALKQQIEQECEKFDGETPPAPIRKLKSRRGQGDEEEETEEEEKVLVTQPDISDILPRVDISNQLTEALLNELSDKNWKVRCEALQKIINILNETKLIKGSLGELPQGLALRLVDSNSKISQTTLSLCENLATAMGPPIKQHIRTLFPGFLQCLGDSKAWIRTAAVSCMNTWGEQCGYKEFFDGEMIGSALKSGSPTLRNELWTWLAEKLPGIPTKQVSKEELLFCLPHLFSNVEDRNSDVRKSAQEAVLGFMIHLSYEAMLRQTEKLKPGSRTGVVAVLDKIRPNMPVKPLPSKKIAPIEESAPKVVKSGGAVKASKVGVKTKGAGGAAKTTSSRKKDDDVDTSPLLAVNNMKHQRSIDEQKLKILKWNFTTPREEFVDLLKDLMFTANVNKTLMANMFHSDFRYHLKAIESLTEDLPDNSKALVSNLDLILKWLTLRFFDTNPSVLLKGLDYLQTVFNFLIEDQYHMLENEAASFIPYLILKIGDPKEPVRNGVKALFKQIALVYPVSKLFSYVMEGLKSKNSRQRAECLDQLGCLIESYGVTVCQPSPSAALKEVAKQIADRDNSVRNAALNCIVQAYYLEGERIYKLIGQISEKDQSLLDERIKRAAKNRPSKTVTAAKTRVSQAPAPTNESNEMDENNYDDEPEDEPKMEEENDENIPYEYHPQIQLQQQQPAPVKVSGPFGLDMDLLQKIEMSAPVKCRVPTLIEPNIDLNESVEMLNPAHQRLVIPISPPKLLVPNSENVSPLNSSANKEDSLDRAILGTASLDLSVAIQSMSHMETFLKSNQAFMVKSKEDKFINSINMQLKLLQTYPLHQGNAQVSKGFRTTFMVILTFYDSPVGLGKNVSLPHLKNLVDQLIGFLAENKLEKLNDAEAYVRVINTIVLKIIDSSDHTTIICVLIKLLHERVGSNGPVKYEDLIMKCLWKVVKTIPNWAGDLNYDTILLEMHNFFRDYPTSWWKKQQKADTPMRTIKTVLHAMTKVKGSTILSHLTQINNTDESELRPYLMRLITSVKTDDVNVAKKSSSQLQNQKRSPDNRSGVSKQVQQQLSEIFKKIGSKNQAQEGLVQLYDFKLQYPEANVQPFLEKSHQYFQDFIEQGLKDIDKTRNKNQNLLTGQVNNNQHSADGFRLVNSHDDGKNMMDPLLRLERLRALEARCMTSHSNEA